LLFVQPFFLFVLLPVAVFVFYLTRHYVGRTAALAVIVAASAIFYAPYGALPATLLATSLCLNLIIGIALSHDGVTSPSLRKILLATGLSLNFAALATFKYLDQVAALVAPSVEPILGIAIPAGISFYTFHQSVFLLDAYKRQTDVVVFLKGANNVLGGLAAFIRYAAFVAFFPQLVIGPITYMSEFAPQALRQSFGRPRITDLQVGTTLIIVGLFKKICIADTLAIIINPIFGELTVGAPITSAQALLAILGYFFQLYFDFSGYSDIALGIARLFGIRLPINFDSPLRATGIVDFYRRWHMTLTRVIVLFIFTPLSLWGMRVAIGRGYKGWRRRALGGWLPFLINFQIIALWHSAQYTFVLFGLIHGLWYVVENEVRNSKSFKAYRSRTSDRWRMLAGIAVTVVPLTLTFALFRSTSLDAFWNLVLSLVGLGTQPSEPFYINRREWLKIGVAGAIVYLLPNVYEMLKLYRPGIKTFDNPSITPYFLRAVWRPNLIWAVFVSLLAVAVFVNINIPAPFLYAGF